MLIRKGIPGWVGRMNILQSKSHVLYKILRELSYPQTQTFEREREKVNSDCKSIVQP